MKDKEIIAEENTCSYSGLRSTSSYAAKYIFLLDFNDGKVYRYDISLLCNEDNSWNPDSESCEAFLHGAGHKLSDCEWMVTSEKDIEYEN
jgi:hypothetical protein